MNFQAALRAKDSNAHRAALRLLRQSRDLYGPALWKQDYEQALSLYHELAACSFLHAELEEMESACAILLRKPRPPWTGALPMN